MIVEYLRYHVGPDRREALLLAYEQAAALLDAAPECLAYELSECEEQPGSFLLRIEWKSTEAHMQGFRTGANFLPFYALVRPFFADIQEMRHYHLTAVQRRK